jgi:single-strand DNA-binding protein
MPSGVYTRRLTPEQLHLAGLLADTDLGAPLLAHRFGLSAGALQRRKATVYRAYGVHSRAGLRFAKFRIASTPRTFDKNSNEWKDGEPLFLACNIWRQAAENVAESLQRGSRVIVTGRLKQRSYETREGEKRTVIELEVDEIGPSLKYATAKVQKMQRSSSSGGTAQQGGGFGGDDPWSTAAPAGGKSQSSFGDEPPF